MDFIAIAHIEHYYRTFEPYIPFRGPRRSFGT